jgi:uncharacterized protein (TIGR02996 family)
MATEAELLAAVLAHPDEDTPRLVYADWLDENAAELPGRDPQEVRDRAAFIRAQIDRANNPDAVPSPDEEADHDRLHKLALSSWVPRLPRWAKSPQFARGFVEQIACSPNDFIRRADELFAVAPIRRVQFNAGCRQIDVLAQCPHLRRIRAFDFGRFRLSTADVLTLLESPHFGGGVSVGLRSLELGCHESDYRLEEAAALAAAPLGEVHTLNLRYRWARGEALGLLAAAPWIRTVQALHLTGNNRIGSELMAALASAPLDSVRDLHLPVNYLEDESAAILASAPWLRGVRRLNLSNNWIRDDGAVALANSPHLTSLEHFCIDHNPIGVAGVQALLDSPAIPPATTVRPAWDQIDADERPKAVAELAKYGDRVSLPEL